MKTLDKRLTPARRDLAASYLRGEVEAERYVEGVTMQVIDVTAPLRSAPSPEAELNTEALHGERVVVYEETVEGWAWGQL
ncbi:MAG: peptidase P60, partial [Xanthobacteraceae bacterium]